MPPSSQDSYINSLDDEEDYTCPLCIEEMDMSDRNFKPCPCGYQVCQFCWNHIRTNLNGNCPACRRPYSEQTAEFKAVSTEEYKQDKERAVRLKRDQRLKERERKEGELTSRKHLQNVRVVQKNLVYVIGLAPRVSSTDELIPVLRSNDYFGQYGKVQKIVVNRLKNQTNTNPNTNPNIGIYVTYYSKEDAQRAMEAIDGSINEGRILRASYGTTKYCTSYLRNTPCQNPNCMYLHEAGNDGDSYSREDLSTIQHAAKQAAARGNGKPSTIDNNNALQRPIRQDSMSSNNDSDSAIGTGNNGITIPTGPRQSAWGRPTTQYPSKQAPGSNPLLIGSSSSLGPGISEQQQPPKVWATTASANTSPKSIPAEMDRTPSSTPSLSSNNSMSIGSRQLFFDRTLEVLTKGPLKFQFSKAFLASDDFKAASEVRPLFSYRKELPSKAQIKG